MNYTIIKPCENLKNFVSYFWVTRWYGNEKSGSNMYYSTADSFTKMVFAFQRDKNRSRFLFSGLQGQTRTFGQFPIMDSGEMVGVSFFSYAVPLLFGVPAGEVNNLIVDLEVLMGKEADRLNGALEAAPNDRQKVALLSSFLQARLLRNQIEERSVVEAMQRIRLMKGVVNIKNFVEDYSLSQKQFERKFLACSGFTPKLYARIVRFENTLESYPKFSSLTELAYAMGYYDQSHFIHDFKKFSGFNPRQYFSLVEY